VHGRVGRAVGAGGVRGAGGGRAGAGVLSGACSRVRTRTEFLKFANVQARPRKGDHGRFTHVHHDSETLTHRGAYFTPCKTPLTARAPQRARLVLAGCAVGGITAAAATPAPAGDGGRCRPPVELRAAAAASTGVYVCQVRRYAFSLPPKPIGYLGDADGGFECFESKHSINHLKKFKIESITLP
jgi:hypothetical protein